MKKWQLLSIGMVMIHLIFPLCLLIAYLLDMEFILYSQWVYELVVTGLFVAAGILRLVKDAPALLWDWFLIPTVLLNGACLISRAGGLALLFMLVNLIYAGIITCRRESWDKVLMIMICIPSALYITWVGWVNYLFSGWPNGEIIYQMESPSGKYTARILREYVWLDDPEICVEVVNNGRLTVLFGEFQHKPRNLHLTYEQDETVQVVWLDEDTLSVNGKVFDIS